MYGSKVMVGVIVQEVVLVCSRNVLRAGSLIIVQIAMLVV